MGIPRLTQDLAPYQENVLLSRQKPLTEDARPCITRVVIDGPSLVYAVLSKILPFQSYIFKPTAAPKAPSYSEINDGVLQLLRDLESHGVEIPVILFDGGLPVHKRPTRLARMEQLRVQLELYRNSYSKISVSAREEPLNLQDALWDPSVLSVRKPAPIAPPFMVASVIEHLQANGWQDRVNVVPGEADCFCASAAKLHNAAIITNDSDLALYDLGPDGRLVHLRSIAMEVSEHGDKVITATSLDLTSIARSLKLASLLPFGFERYEHPELTTAMVSERARSQTDDMDNPAYKAFVEQFTEIPSVSPQSSLSLIDPRVAEIIVNLIHDEPPAVYLTPILEDPGRDSSWSYGLDIRQLAYSLIAGSPEPKNGKPITFTEYARKGPRIAENTVDQLDPKTLKTQLMSLIQQVEGHIRTPRSDVQTLLGWYMLAFHQVQQQKVAQSKAIFNMTDITRAIGLKMTGLTNTITWEILHVIANAQAVLYSLRMLKQIAIYVNLSDNRCTDDFLLRQLITALDSLPPIQDLFLDVSDLRTRIATLDVRDRHEAFLSHLSQDDNEEEFDMPKIGKDSRPHLIEEPLSKSAKRRSRAKTQATTKKPKTNRNVNSFQVLMNS
ncbi:hypothetical protein PV10_07357 [Exophiala mesophila]|uniref:Asteroid domain-containing protein n=1 Tax=Exophiala mesophila TaxID=212818 RepID=A0A0D1Z5F1_EXOME|nr:uncharacterized protein PV10_07357 [Exophiala mesophila]KIV90007.1 hypothetical protein PV10_07357 [Exophiala mesophila]